MRIPTILGTRYFRDRSRCHIRVWRPRKPPEIVFAPIYTKMNKIPEEDALTHHPGHQILLEPNPMSSLCLATSKTLKDNFYSILYQGEWELPKKCTYPPSWAPMIPGPKPVSYSCSATLKILRNNFRSILYQDK